MRKVTRNTHPFSILLLLMMLSACAGSAAKETLQPYRQAVKENPDDPGVYFELGQTALQVERNNEAIKALKRCIELDPQNVEAYVLRAVAYNNKGVREYVFRDLRKALELEEMNSNANMMLGAMGLSMIIMFENMGTLNIIGMGSRISDGQIILLSTWDIYLEDMINIYEECLQIWKRMVEIDSENPLCWGNLGLIANLTNNLQGSAVAFNQAIMLDSEFLTENEFHEKVYMATLQKHKWVFVPPM